MVVDGVGPFFRLPGRSRPRVLKPVLEKVVAEYGDRVHYVVVDIEDAPQIAEAAGGTPLLRTPQYWPTGTHDSAVTIFFYEKFKTLKLHT